MFCDQQVFWGRVLCWIQQNSLHKSVRLRISLANVKISAENCVFVHTCQGNSLQNVSFLVTTVRLTLVKSSVIFCLSIII